MKKMVSVLPSTRFPLPSAPLLPAGLLSPPSLCLSSLSPSPLSSPSSLLLLSYSSLSSPPLLPPGPHHSCAFQSDLDWGQTEGSLPSFLALLLPLGVSWIRAFRLLQLSGTNGNKCCDHCHLKGGDRVKGNGLTPMKGFHRAARWRQHLSGMLVEKTALGWRGRKGKVGNTPASMVSALQPGHPHPTREAASQQRGTEDRVWSASRL